MAQITEMENLPQHDGPTRNAPPNTIDHCDRTSRWVREEFSDGTGRWVHETKYTTSDGTVQLVREIQSPNPNTRSVVPEAQSRNAQIDGGVPAAQSHNAQRDGGTSENDMTDFFKNMGAVATLGASITFVLIAVELQDPLQVSRTHYFTISTVRIFLSISWLLFMLTLGCSFWLSTMGSNDFIGYIMYILILTAILFSSLVVAAYVEWVGFLAVALSGLMAVVIPVVLCFQNIIPHLVTCRDFLFTGRGGRAQNQATAG